MVDKIHVALVKTGLVNTFLIFTFLKRRGYLDLKNQPSLVIRTSFVSGVQSELHLNFP